MARPTTPGKIKWVSVGLLGTPIAIWIGQLLAGYLWELKRGGMPWEEMAPSAIAFFLTVFAHVCDTRENGETPLISEDKTRKLNDALSSIRPFQSAQSAGSIATPVPDGVSLLGVGDVLGDAFAHAHALLDGVAQGGEEGGNALVAFHDLKIDLHAAPADKRLLGSRHEASADALSMM
jgi:hypothetical protein